MNKTKLLERKCAPLLAATTGLAVCITGGYEASAAVITGPIGPTNYGNTVFTSAIPLRAFGSQADWWLSNPGPGLAIFPYAGPDSLNVTGGPLVVAHSIGVTISSGMAGAFTASAVVPGNVANKYFAVKFLTPGVTFGWVHVVSTDALPTTITLDTWGYENMGGTIKTLSDSLTARKLTLADGKAKLHWTNSNEDGVSRYEVQAKDAEGEWQAVDSDVPGDGRYTLKTENQGDYRLMVEKIDGTSETVDF